jgi:hypothetical protein
MPLELISGEVVPLASGRQLSDIGVANLSSRGESQQTLTNCVEHVRYADFEKISATSSLHPHPRREDLIVPDSEDERVSNADSYAEMEVDSSLEQDTSTQTRPSRLHRAVRTEVRL